MKIIFHYQSKMIRANYLAPLVKLSDDTMHLVSNSRHVKIIKYNYPYESTVSKVADDCSNNQLCKTVYVSLLIILFSAGGHCLRQTLRIKLGTCKLRLLFFFFF